MIQTIFIVAMVVIAIGLLVSVPVLSISIPASVASSLISICQVSAYLLPIKLLMPIIIFSFSFHTFKFLWAVVLRVKSFIPMGGGN